MCTPKAKGGQRCVSSTTKSLTSATKRYERTVGQYDQVVARDGGPALRADLRARVMKSYFAWEDALVEHATTDAGAAEIEGMLASSPDHQADSDGDGYQGPITLSYMAALQDGAWLRGQRTEIKKIADSGGVWASLLKKGEWPREADVRLREQQVAAASAREFAAARTPVNLPAGVVPDDGYEVADVYFACETHNKPGSCTQECAALVANMGDDGGGVDYDPTGTSYGPPKPYLQYHYDQAQRASIAVAFTPT